MTLLRRIQLKEAEHQGTEKAKVYRQRVGVLPVWVAGLKAHAKRTLDQLERKTLTGDLLRQTTRQLKASLDSATAFFKPIVAEARKAWEFETERRAETLDPIEQALAGCKEVIAEESMAPGIQKVKWEGLSVTKGWTLDAVTDAMVIPREFMQPDLKKIEALVRELGPLAIEQCPGITVKERRTVRVTAAPGD